jgi:hypothetical protein
MYQSPPPAPAWTRRHWIAAIGAGALGSALALAIIVLAGGVVSAGVRGILIGAAQVVFQTWLLRRIQTRQPERAKNRRGIIIAVLVTLAIFAYLLRQDLNEGQVLGDRMSMMLGIFGALTGPMLVFGRYLKGSDVADGGGADRR